MSSERIMYVQFTSFVYGVVFKKLLLQKERIQLCLSVALFLYSFVFDIHFVLDGQENLAISNLLGFGLF